MSAVKFEPDYTQVYQDEIIVSCDDHGGLHWSLPVSEVRHPEVGHVVYVNGTRWEIEEADSESVFLVFRPQQIVLGGHDEWRVRWSDKSVDGPFTSKREAQRFVRQFDTGGAGTVMMSRSVTVIATQWTEEVI